MGLVDGVRSLRGWLIYVAVVACLLTVAHLVSGFFLLRGMLAASDVPLVGFVGVAAALHLGVGIFVAYAAWQFLSRDPRAPTTCIRALALSCGLRMLETILLILAVNGVDFDNALRLMQQLPFMVGGIVYLSRSKRVQERFGVSVG